MNLRSTSALRPHSFKPIISRKQQYRLNFRHPAILAIVLAMLIQGCTTLTSSPASSLPPETEPDIMAEPINEITTDLSTPLIQPTVPRSRIKTATPTAEILAIHNISTPTPLFLPEPTSTLEPTSTSTSRPSATATSLPLVPASPTSTPLPISTDTPTPPATDTPIPIPTQTVPSPSEIEHSKIEHVVIISIDGLRPDALDIADTPVLDALRASGSYFPNAQTVKQSWTLPSHASMLSGMLPEKHGLLWSLPYIGWPGMDGPTLFNIAHEAGLSTSMVFGKEKLNYVVLGDSADRLFGEDAHDPEVKEHAVEFIQEGLANVLFIHFPDTDRVGHAYGWMSTNQFYAITFVDGLIGEVVAALESGGYLNRTLLLITADHGGRSQSHGDDSPLDRTIPWLAVGPNVPQNVIYGRNINTYDTAATVLYALDLPIPEKWDGQPVMEIFQ